MHRTVLRDVALAARKRRIGKIMAPPGWSDRASDSLNPRIVTSSRQTPKLFRRCVDHLACKEKRTFAGTFLDWLSGHGSHASTTPDRVVTSHAANIRLCSLIREHGNHVALETDINDLVFVES